MIGSKNGHTPYGCTCGSYVDASTRVQELMVDKMNEAPLMEIPIFDDPFTLSVEFSIAVVLILGKIGSIVANALYLPTIIGFLLCGMGMQDIINPGLIKGAGGNGPHSTPFGEMRIFALIVVLMRAGISLKPKAIYKEGIYIFCLAIIPYFAEFIIEMFLGVKLLGWNASETGLFASILAALSPSLVIPGMLHLVEQKLGHTPKNVLTSAPIEVVLAIILYNIFSSFVTSATNPTYPWIASFPLWANILLIPVNILYSSVIGSLAGYALHRYYKYRNELTTNKVENTVTRLTNNNAGEYLFAAIATCYLLYALCQPMYLQVTSGILAVFACMLTVAELAEEKVVEQLKSGLAGLWVFVEVILFTTTGINLSFKNATGPLQSDRGISTSDIGNLVIILFVGSFGRACGVFVSMLLSLHTFPAYKRNLTYLAAVWLTTWVFTIPKATIQATLGGLPYAQHIIPGASGLTKGAYIQHATAFAVLLMAPIGVFLTAMVGKPIAAWLHEFEVTNDPNYHEVCVASASAKVDCELVDIEKIVESTDEIEGIQKLPTNEVVSNL